ncbi:MAG: UDP-N-acetylglucosamine 2-epimerase, partial [Lentilitoribacter sp.]
FIVSIHREENVDNRDRLTSLVNTLNALAEKYGFPVIVSTHPRTRNRLESLDGMALDDRVRYLKPFGFHDYNHLQMKSFCAISDSGTIAEESSILGFPAITPRDAIERPEALDTGNIIVTGLNEENILESVAAVTAIFQANLENEKQYAIPTDYLIENTAERVAKLIIGTARLSNDWDGIRLNDF